jgi:hypothetical protein
MKSRKRHFFSFSRSLKSRAWAKGVTTIASAFLLLALSSLVFSNPDNVEIAKGSILNRIDIVI